MTIHFTSREFNQDIARAKRAALGGPVIISDRGRPAHVLLSYDDYCKLNGRKMTLADLLAWPGTEDIELELPARTIGKPFEFDDE